MKNLLPFIVLLIALNASGQTDTTLSTVGDHLVQSANLTYASIATATIVPLLILNAEEDLVLDANTIIVACGLFSLGLYLKAQDHIKKAGKELKLIIINKQ